MSPVPFLMVLHLVFAGPSWAAETLPSVQTSTLVFHLETAPAQMKTRVENAREMFQRVGYQFDEKTDTILSPQPQKPITTAEVEKLLFALARGKKYFVIQNFYDVLSKQESGKPPPPEVVQELKRVAANFKEDLSPSLFKALDGALDAAASASTARLGAKVESASLDSARFWDGSKTMSKDIQGAFPVVAGGWNDPHQRPPADDTQRKLSDTLQAEVAGYLANNPAGAELVEKFRGKDGKLRLPHMFVRKLNTPNRGKAQYVGDLDSVILMHQVCVDKILARQPEKDRPALAKRLADPKKLAEFLLGDSKARAALIQDMDVVLFHEMTHAWQARRNHWSVEQMRDNVPSCDLIEEEHEAFLNQNRYFHRKLLADPNAAMDPRGDGYAYYLSMLTDFKGWRDEITRTYLAANPKGAITLKTVEELQHSRRQSVKGLLARNPAKTTQYLLRFIGLGLGEEAIVELRSDYDRRMQGFLKEEYSQMRVEGLLKVSEGLLAQGQPNFAFDAAGFAKMEVAAHKGLFSDETALKAAQAVEKAAAAGVAWAKKAQGVPNEELIAFLDGFKWWLEENRKPWPKDAYDVFLRTHIFAAEQAWKSYAGSNTVELKGKELAHCASLLQALEKPPVIADFGLTVRLHMLRVNIAAAQKEALALSKK